MVVALLNQILNIFIFQVWEGLGVVKTCRDILGETDPVSNSHQIISKRNEICAESHSLTGSTEKKFNGIVQFQKISILPPRKVFCCEPPSPQEIPV